MAKKDYYEKLNEEQINEGIAAFIKYGPIKAGSITVDNFNLYKLLYAYFGSVEKREQMNRIAEEYEKKIDLLDRQIDNLVYELYELTAEEIKIVEGSV